MRDSILLAYRIAGPLFILISIATIIEELGLAAFNERTLPGPVYTFYVAFTFLMVFAIPAFMIFAVWAAAKHWGDWVVMVPALMLCLFAVSILWGAFAPEGVQDYGTYLFAASFLGFGLAATWSGWLGRA